MPEPVVLGAVDRVETDRGAEDAVRPHRLRLALAQQYAVGAEHRREPLLRGVGRNVPDVLAEQRLAAGEDQEDVRVDERDLVHDPPALVGRQFAPRIGARERRHITMRALEIAPLGQIPRHAIRRIRRRRADVRARSGLRGARGSRLGHTTRPMAGDTGTARGIHGSAGEGVAGVPPRIRVGSVARARSMVIGHTRK